VGYFIPKFFQYFYFRIRQIYLPVKSCQPQNVGEGENTSPTNINITPDIKSFAFNKPIGFFCYKNFLLKL